MSVGWNSNSLIHTGLDPGVLKQLKLRGDTLKKAANRSTSDIVYLNSSTSWVKVSSGVDTEDSREKDGFSSDKARKNVLLGGLLNSTQKQKSGIFKSSDDAYNLTEQGYRPMAGITGFQSEVLGTYGTYQRVAVDFQVNSLDELTELESLYLRPGMNVLVEWGHSIYKKFKQGQSKGELVTTVQTVSDFFDNVTSTPEEEDTDNLVDKKEPIETQEAKSEQQKLKDKIFDEIDNLKLKSNGNYDAILGKVTNFNFAFNGDGTYNCQFVALAHGALMESVRLLISSTTSEDSTAEDAGETRDTTRFNTFLNIIREQGLDGTLDETIESLKAEIPEDYAAFEERVASTKRPLKIVRIGKTGDESETIKGLHYIPLSNFLELINIIFMPKTDVEDVKSNDIELFAGQKLGKKSNKQPAILSPYLTFPGHFSHMPSVCFLPKNREFGDPFSYFFTNEEEIFSPRDNDILDIMVETGYLIKTFEHIISPSESSKEDQSVYDFVRLVLNTIENALGNVNSFDFHHPNQRDIACIVDRKVTPSGKDIAESVLQVRGLESTLTAFKIDSKLSSDMMATMAIGASAAGTDVGEDLLAVQSWNKGIRDRFNTNPGYMGNNTDELSEEDRAKQQRFSKLLDYVCDIDRSTLAEVDGVFRKEIRDGQSTQNDPKDYINIGSQPEGIKAVFDNVMQDLYKLETRKKSTSPSGLIPIDISFTCKGISGFKIGQGFSIQTGILPKRYDDKVGFIIKSLSHKISSDNKWTTDVAGVMTILSKPELVDSDFNLDEFIKTVQTNKAAGLLSDNDIPPGLFAWPIPTSESPAGLDENGQGPDTKVAFMNSFRREGGGGTGSGKDGARRATDRQHKGLDISAPPGTKMVAAIDGNISYHSKYTAKGGPFLQIKGTGDYQGYVIQYGYCNHGVVGVYDPVTAPGGGSLKEVKAGEHIGYMTDMVGGHPKVTSLGVPLKPEQSFVGYGGKMVNHVHFRVTDPNGTNIDPETLPYKTVTV